MLRNFVNGSGRRYYIIIVSCVHLMHSFNAYYYMVHHSSKFESIISK